jgi:hypothetical protein
MSVIKIQTGLRIDETTYGKLKTLAQQENRSLNNLVEYIIRQYLTEFEKKNGPLEVYEEEQPEN